MSSTAQCHQQHHDLTIVTACATTRLNLTLQERDGQGQNDNNAQHPNHDDNNMTSNDYPIPSTTHHPMAEDVATLMRRGQRDDAVTTTMTQRGDTT